jgi:hypothetical protein
MVKPRKILFTEALESVLINIWGGTKDHLDDSLIRKTREALVEIRGIYRFRGDFKGKYPSSIQYRLPRNRAGYLAAFGQRHAYPAYIHMKKIAAIKPEAIPQPDKKGKIVVTVVGAGAAIETYGVCLFYNENEQKIHRLQLNLIEKESAWKPNRHTVFEKLLKGTFPKLDIIPWDIDIDLTKDSISKLANDYDKIRETDILLIYNVLNEIHVNRSRIVWKNLDFILRTCAKPLLILVMEPSVPKARPRVDWLKKQLVQYSDLILDEGEEEISFESEPFMIKLEGTNLGLNDRLFGQSMDGGKPILQKSVKRTHIACLLKPHSPVTMEQVDTQLKKLQMKRGKQGRFIKDKINKSFWEIYPSSIDTV